MNREQINIWLLSAAILAVGLHALVWMTLLASWMPAAYITQAADFYLRGRVNFPKEYDLPIFRALAAVVLALTFAAYFMFKDRLGDQKLTVGLTLFLSVAMVCAVPGYFAVFGMAFHGHPQWAHDPREGLASLPYFWPLRYRAFGTFMFSFALPLMYMFVLLQALAQVMRRPVCVRATARLVLSAAGLAWFIVYVRHPLVNGCWAPGLPLLIILALWRREKITNTVWAGLLSGAQAALLCAWVQEQVKAPIAPADFSTLAYAVFIAVSLIVFMGIVAFRTQPAGPFMALQAVLSILAAMALFKLIVYDYRADLARWWFKILGWMVIAQPLLWILGRQLLSGLRNICGRLDSRLGHWWPDVLIAGVIAACVYVPDTEALLAHMFCGEHLHHFDHFVMAPAWVMAQGGVLDVDARSQYGIGSIAVFNGLMALMGGISYAHGLAAVILLCTVYFVLVYVFLRRWLPGRWLAIACWAMIFKAQIAFELAFPVVYTYPQATVARQWWDILWLIQMLYFLDKRDARWLIGASLTAGAALWHVPSTGFYLAITHCVMAVMAGLRRGTWQSRLAACVWPVGLMMACAVILYASTCGIWFFRPVFWRNLIDFFHIVMLVSASFMTQTMANQTWDVFIFGVIALVYLGTAVKAGLDYLRGRDDRREWLLLGLAIYGLGSLEHYVTLSAGNNYYTKALPFFVLVFYWLAKALPRMAPRWRRGLSMAIAGAAVVALATNHSFIAYPGALNISRNPLLDPRVARPLPNGGPYFFHKHRYLPPESHFPINSLGERDDGWRVEGDFKDHQALITYFRRQTDFTMDAVLIDELTSPDDHVPLISSYEVMILMQAKRRPFFYIFPFLDNRPMHIRSFGVDLLHTRGQMRDIIAGFEERKPPFVFMEKIMLLEPSSNWYEETAPGLMDLLRYVKAHYQPYQAGQYLVAMKRKE
ncbi:MAG: hypothetical protein HY591_02730 [Candidatus Omnitrophica bacterium]|nr:hypothetical protein [Candidatus Omnitrophota bacterium]